MVSCGNTVQELLQGKDRLACKLHHHRTGIVGRSMRHILLHIVVVDPEIRLVLW